MSQQQQTGGVLDFVRHTRVVCSTLGSWKIRSREELRTPGHIMECASVPIGRRGRRGDGRAPDHELLRLGRWVGDDDGEEKGRKESDEGEHG